MPEKIGMPSVSGVRNSAVDYALGAGGGLLYALSVGFTGSGLLGGLIGAGIAGSVIKGSHTRFSNRNGKPECPRFADKRKSGGDVK